MHQWRKDELGTKIIPSDLKSFWKLDKADLCPGPIFILFPIPMFEYCGAWELEAPGTESRTDKAPREIIITYPQFSGPGSKRNRLRQEKKKKNICDFQIYGANLII